MSNKIRAIIIDPFEREISETEIENNLEGLKSAIGDHWIELVRINGQNDMYVDEEGLFRENQQFFVMSGSQRKVPIAGKAVVVGSDTSTGEQINCNMPLDVIKEMVSFHSVLEMQIMSKRGDF